jgi:hypothetical protein
LFYPFRCVTKRNTIQIQEILHLNPPKLSFRANGHNKKSRYSSPVDHRSLDDLCTSTYMSQKLCALLYFRRNAEKFGVHIIRKVRAIGRKIRYNISTCFGRSLPIIRRSYTAWSAVGYGKRKCCCELWCPVVSLVWSVLPWHCLSGNHSDNVLMCSRNETVPRLNYARM